ncbi:YcgL domain-containing protein [Arenimonas fontis]|uniref:YcgL domain-containing protein F0415_08140 n=1 Tax=Arenimonas fontis TaxID=2608255 RepID=A0A5B2ZBJ8_9GAMM|nr:YcgL domain-containing protein [Arenimonas fontis]KAA2284660.1 YcgL domain-containing protein [Arenimonas fontis]
MQAYVYKSLRKADTYVFLRKRDDFAVLPEPVRAPLGQLAFVLALELDEGRRLARADAGVVRANLAARGFHVQFPPALATVPPADD